jgi:hypothetical protein
MTTLKVGIASYAQKKARTLAVARGKYRIIGHAKFCRGCRRDYSRNNSQCVSCFRKA